jgi:hypothetical protein
MLMKRTIHIYDLEMLKSTCACQHSYNYQVFVVCDEFSIQIGMTAGLTYIQ